MIAQAHAFRLPLKSKSVHCVVTSPPYWQMRSYKTAPQIWGGDSSCPHFFQETPIGRGNGDGKSFRRDREGWWKYGATQPGTCLKCGAWKGEYGMEPLPDCLGWTRMRKPCGQCFICHTLEIFREIWRVLRPDGTLWVNIGDSYSSSGSGPGVQGCSLLGGPPRSKTIPGVRWYNRSQAAPPGLRRKDLIGIPHRLRFALQYDGWCCRSEIIWHKANVMPESTKDRPCRDHEFVYVFSKQRHYYYDQEAIKEEASPEIQVRYGRQNEAHKEGQIYYRNRRTFWSIASTSYEGAHYATFPEELVEPMIMAGTSEKGCCPICGAPWKRILVPTKEYAKRLGKGYFSHKTKDTIAAQGMNQPKNNNFISHGVALYETKGWTPTCKCPGTQELTPAPCIVLDPFCGSATTGRVALRNRRKFVGIDLQLSYLREQARDRLTGVQEVVPL